jgi:hypothetical protein
MDPFTSLEGAHILLFADDTFDRESAMVGMFDDIDPMFSTRVRWLAFRGLPGGSA